MAAGDFLSRVELISPAELAKSTSNQIQEYFLLALQSVGQSLQAVPLYVADMVQQADLIGLALCRLS